MHDEVNTLYAALVTRYGGCDAVAALHEARFGKGSKGTISKMCSGDLNVTVSAAMVLEDALRSYPITGRLASRCDKPMPTNGDICDLTARASTNAAAIVAAVMQARSPASDGGIDITPAEKAAIEGYADRLRDNANQLLALTRDHG